MPLAFVELALPKPEVSVQFLTAGLDLTFSEVQPDYWLATASTCRLGLFRQKIPQDISYFQSQALVFFRVADLTKFLEKIENCQGVIKKPPKSLKGFGSYVTVADQEGICWGAIA